MADPSAPILTDYANGQGTLSGGNLNTFLQTCDNLSQLRAFTGTTGLQVFLRGYSAPNDGGQGNFYWSATATGPDNGTTIIVPTGAIVGAWLRIVSIIGTPGSSGLVFCGDGSGSALTAGVMRAGLCPFAGTLTAWALQADVTGSAVLDVWAKPFVNDSPPSVANTICAGVYPTLAGNIQIASTALTGWTTAVAANTAFIVNIRSVATVTKLTLTLTISR